MEMQAGWVYGRPQYIYYQGVAGVTTCKGGGMVKTWVGYSPGQDVTINVKFHAFFFFLLLHGTLFSCFPLAL
jgi:hypothetical protein